MYLYTMQYVLDMRMEIFACTQGVPNMSEYKTSAMRSPDYLPPALRMQGPQASSSKFISGYTSMPNHSVSAAE